MTQYSHDIMIGYGWEDICVMHKITDPVKMHRVRELVIYGSTRKPKPFSIAEWRTKSGLRTSHRAYTRPDRPPKIDARCVRN